MKQTWKELWRGEQASSMVELALLLPVLLLLLLGVIDLGHGYRTYSILATAAHEGVRWLTIYPSDGDGARAVVVADVGRAGLTSEDITITFTPAKSSYAAGESVTITVTHNYPLMFGVFTGVASVPFRTQVTMRVLYG